VTWFQPGEARAWERTGRFYERVFGIKAWKDRLPDAARWYGGGFAKGTLAAAEPEYLRRFIRETWRGELCHWSALACTPSSSCGTRGGATSPSSPTRSEPTCPVSWPSATTASASAECWGDDAHPELQLQTKSSNMNNSENTRNQGLLLRAACTVSVDRFRAEPVVALRFLH